MAKQVQKIIWDAKIGQNRVEIDTNEFLPIFLPFYGAFDGAGRFGVVFTNATDYTTVWLIDDMWITVDTTGPYKFQNPANNVEPPTLYGDVFAMYLEANKIQHFHFERPLLFRGNDVDSGSPASSGIYLLAVGLSGANILHSTMQVREMSRTEYDELYR